MSDWNITAIPRFIEVVCPKHRKDMQQLRNGLFGNPVWWCSECQYPYELKLTKLREWNQEAVDEQLKENG